MTDRSPVAPLLGALVLAGALAAAPGAARAQGYAGPPRACAPAPCRRPPPPPGYGHGYGYGPPAVVSGYLPRNNNVPMYNEPPTRPPAW